jgi:hypothetical protein
MSPPDGNVASANRRVDRDGRACRAHPGGIALLHGGKRHNAALAMLIFAAAAVVTMVVVASEDRQFNGPFRADPEALRQVLLPPGA